MPRTAWTFYDPVDDETYNWEINPNEGGYPARNKNILFEATAAPNGHTVAQEGRDTQETFSFSGVILTLNTWFEKRNQILLTDDLGREFWIYIKSFNPTRQRSAKYPWRHNYTIDAIILDFSS